MGKRKERRLAAMAAAGRRVKLDLFLDPSPGEASLKEGVGGNVNGDQQTGVPTSPSSSDKKEENPLALLGQYSDDEVDDEAADQPNGAIKESPTDTTAQVIHEGEQSGGDKGDVNTDMSASGGVQQEAPQDNDVKNYTDNGAEEISVAPEPSLESESVLATQFIPDSSSMQSVGDIAGNWKAVMLEHSNQCYYWNTVTGETSWEIPNGLASGVADDGITSASVATHIDYPIEAQAHVLPHSTAVAYPSDVTVGNSGIAAYTSFGTDCVSGQLTHDAYAYTAAVACQEPMDIDPLHLVKYGEDLLQRLNLLKRLHGSIDGLELIKREIEIRISDCNALSSYGSSLLPLWLHAEVHLKQLESSLSKFEASFCAEPRHENTEVNEYKAPKEAEMMTFSNGEDLKFEVHTVTSVNENVKIEGPSSSAQNLQENDSAVVPSKVESDNEGVDMDVEMEVDEENIEGLELPSSVSNREPPMVEQLESTTLESSPAPPKDTDIPPPPPEDEWIPPPPPENELAPPPPPEESIVSYTHDTIPPSYQGQTNLAYAHPGVEYYSTAAMEVDTNANYYMQASESHIMQQEQPSYYVPISVPVDVTPVDPISYYSYPSATPAAPGVSAELPGYYAASVAAISSDALDNKTGAAPGLSANSILHPAKSDEVLVKEAPVASTSEALETSIVGSSMQASTTSKNQTKVVRSKKRTVAVAPSFRSNKKVSSMVDKWKAAKEELRDEEEEPESAYEALERKRQKEIDEWRKQQIASGEAQENSNFVPLGGDWRERVKRRRAEAKTESKSESNPAPAEAPEQHKGDPDLSELSKGLPSGWQAYLDESTKQVYYGNSLTSQTTWDRPTK